MAAVYYHEGQFPPDKRLDWHRLVPLLGPAYSVVARYDGMLSAVPNPRILLAPLSTQEAVLSSRIEGAADSGRRASIGTSRTGLVRLVARLRTRSSFQLGRRSCSTP